MSESGWTPYKLAIGLLPVGLLGLLVVSLGDLDTTRQLFVHTTYYFLLLTLACWVGTYLYAARDVCGSTLLRWVKENWPGLLIAALLTTAAALSVEPALRVLSDEANLVGTSKNLFSSQTATYTVSGKYYYDSYWDIDVAIDQRPTLFPFLISLVHAAVGYSYANAFLLNLMLLPAFVLLAYRLAKSLGGETLGVVSALLVAAHPIILVTVRSGAFDFLAACMSLLCVKSLLDFVRQRSAATLATLWMNLCLFAEVRYESALFIVPVVAGLVLFKLVNWTTLKPYALIYALTPAFLLPRIWQSLLRGNVPQQEPGTTTFSLGNIVNNLREYFLPILEPSSSYAAHSAVLIVLGLGGVVLWLRWLLSSLRDGKQDSSELKFAVLVFAWLVLQALIVFSYVWGRAQYPSAARLLIPIDVFFSFAAAWTLVRLLRHRRPFIAPLIAGVILMMQLPDASQARMMNRLTQTRESASTWAFFERLPDKRILIVTDRPNHFTIMGYGAMTFAEAKSDKHLFTAFERRLFLDVYVIQQLQIATGEPHPGYEIWPDKNLESVFEFQNDANVLVRISRLERPSL